MRMWSSNCWPTRVVLACSIVLLFVSAGLAWADVIDAVIPAPTLVTRLGGVAATAPVRETVSHARTDLGAEGYELVCDSYGCRVTAASPRGLHYGRLTLQQMKAAGPSGPVPRCRIVDKPRMQMRAVMFDLARCKEKHEYYYHMIDQLAHWKINTVFLHLTDDSGCAIEIKRYPFLTTKYAFTQDEMRKLIKYAQDRHIELIPEIESWGHARYITRHPEFEALAENRSRPSTLCTSNPKTWEVLSAIYCEVAAIFPSKYVHAGCDESEFGRCELCKPKGAAVVGEHVSTACRLVRAAGKVPMVWGDVLQLNRAALSQVPKYSIICYWNYKAEVGAEPAQFFRKQGYVVLGCPALVWGGRMLLPASDTFDNIRSFTGVAMSNECLGMETTVWIPQRYIADTLNFGLAYAAELSWAGRERNRLGFARAFCKTYFGVNATTELAQTLWNVHGLSTHGGSIFTNLWSYRGQFEKLATWDLARHTIPGRDKAIAIAGALRRYQAKVRRNAIEYGALQLAADLSVHTGKRAVCAYALKRRLASARRLLDAGEREEARQSLRESAGELERLIMDEDAIRKRLDVAWDRWRYSDDPIKTGGGQNLLNYFIDSDRFVKLVHQRLVEADSQIAAGSAVNWEGILVEPANR